MFQRPGKNKNQTGCDLYWTIQAGTAELSGTDEKENRYPGRPLSIQPTHGGCGAGVREHLQHAGIAPFQSEDQEAGGYPVETLLYGTQSTEDTPLWGAGSDMKGRTGINAVMISKITIVIGTDHQWRIQ